MTPDEKDFNRIMKQHSKTLEYLHMSEKQDELVERVAAAIFHDISRDRLTAQMARAAIAVLRPVIRAEALEEAAKAVDEMPLGYPGNAAKTALEIAAAIRAMKEGD